MRAPPPYNPAMAFKRRTGQIGVEDERDGLRAQHAALEDLKRELAERVRAVQERERELLQAIADAGGPRRDGTPRAAPASAGTGADAREAGSREHAVHEREQAVVARERELELRAEQLAASPPPDPGAEQLAQIEGRLAELREAEKLFLRTREELAGRSEAVAARERLVAQRERALDDLEDCKGRWIGPELSEMEARLRRLELERPGEQTAGFSGGLRKLERGTRSQQRG